MASNVSLTIGNYSFDPVSPDITFSDEIIRTPAGEPINVINRATINGVVTTLGDNNLSPGLDNVVSLQREMRRALLDCERCPQMVLSCGGTTLFSAYVKVTNLSFERSPDNWLTTSNFSLSLEWNFNEDNILTENSLDESGIPLFSGVENSGCYSCLTSFDESWDIQPVDTVNYWDLDCATDPPPEYFTVTHTLSAQGIDCCGPSGITPGWQAAENWVVSRLGTSGIPDCPILNLNFNDPSGGFTFCDLQRTKALNKPNGSYDVTESWTAISASGVPRCLEDFTIESTQSNTDNLITYNVNGTITGFSKRNSDYTLVTSKVQSAKSCWNTIDSSGLILERVNCYFNPTCTINSVPITKSITVSPTAGTLNYSYSYHDKPALFPGTSQIESLSISDVLPAEIVNEIQVPGRQAGPILSRCSSVNATTRSVSITAMMNKPTCTSVSGCNLYDLYNNQLNESGVNQLLCCVENDLNNNYNIVIKSGDNRDWNPFTGNYSRNVTWTYQDCSGTLPGSFC